MMKKIFLALIAFFCMILIYSSCTKTQTTQDDLTLEQIKELSKKVGVVHNNLLDEVSKIIDVNTVSDQEFEKAFYSIKYKDFILHDKYPNRQISFVGIFNNNEFIENNFSKKSEIEKNYLKQMTLQCRKTYSKSIDLELIKISNQILSDENLIKSQKLGLLCALEVARSSCFYWNDAIVNINHPYHNLFQGSNNVVFPHFTCSQIVDMCATYDFYGYYSEGGYPPAQAAQAASQDGSYASGLSSLPGHECGH